VTEPKALAELVGVSKSYVTPGGAQTSVLRGADLRILSGESLAIIGPSGCGKSTLLNLLGTLDRPDAGQVLLDGQDVTGRPAETLARLRSTLLGFVFQAHHLLPQCSLIENALVPAIPRGGVAEAEARARKLLDRVGLGARMDHRPGQLSGGECQRAAVVRALVNRPRLLLADEPTGSLDRAGAESLADLLADLNREEGVALVVVTHSAGLAGRMGRVLELRDGRLGPKS
jgi:lipoprotein-releasing system ATP-binding protein